MLAKRKIIYYRSEGNMNNFQLWQGDLKSNEYTLPLIGNPFKNFLKKLGTFALTTVMAFTLVGCGHDDPVVENPSGDDPTYTEPADPDITDPGDDTDDPVVTPGTDVKDPDDGKDDPVVTPDSGDDTDKDKDDQDKDDFSLAANQKAILENVMPLINYYSRRKYGNSSKVENVYDIYLTKSENSQIVDTIGAVFSGKTPTQGTYLEYGTITLPTQQNLDYESLSKVQQKSSSSLIMTRKYNFIIDTAQNKQYESTIKTIQRKIFDNYDSAVWLGWSGSTWPQEHEHKLVCYDGKQIKETWIAIKNDGGTLSFPDGPVEKYLAKNEYRITNDIEAISLPTDTLKTEAQKELSEQAQQS